MAHVHLIGIGGSGLSAIARFLLESGEVVSGSDRQPSPILEDLERAGARIAIGHRAENIAGADLVVRSSAVSEDNPEVQAARAAGIQVLKRSQYLSRLTAGRQVIAVAGTHGKTTTSAMIAWVLVSLGRDPSYILGGVSKNLGANAHAGQGQLFVIEADEYDYMFLALRPKIAVVTNIEHDHPDCFPTFDDVFQAFVSFASQIETGGVLLACADDPGAARLYRLMQNGKISKVSYGLGEAEPGSLPEISAGDVAPNPQGAFRFVLVKGGRQIVQVSLAVPGRHNVRNALAALGAAAALNLDLQATASALAGFSGVGRRFDLRGEVAGIVVVDDYAHHPSEIRATLAAARTRFPGRPLWAVWQPHTYSRTRLFFDDFCTAFGDADHVLITEVYAAREAIEPGPQSRSSGRQLVAAMHHPDVHFTPAISDATAFLLDHLQPGDVLLVLSAGDADRIGAQVFESLSQKRSSTYAG